MYMQATILYFIDKLYKKNLINYKKYILTNKITFNVYLYIQF